MRKSVMKPARHAIPKSPQVFRVPTTEILRRAHVLRRRKRREEIIISGTEERTFTIHRRLADHSRLMNVEVLERIVENSVAKLISIVMTVRAACATLGHLRGENLFSTLNLCRLIEIRKLGQRIWEQAPLILRPENLKVSHVVVTDFKSFPTQI